MNTLKKIKSFVSVSTFILLTMLIAPLYLGAQPEIKGDATEDAKQKIQELNKKMEEAFRSGDMVNVAEFYADDATVIIPGGKQIQGKKAIYDYLVNKKDSKDFHVELTEVNGSGKILYQVGTLTFTADSNGAKETRSTAQVKVWKRGSDWDYKISVDSFN